MLLRRRGWRLVASGTAGAAAMLHALLLQGGELGFLIVIQERDNFGVRVFADGLHLLARRSVLAGAECFHLAVPFLEQRFDLGLLIGCQGKVVRKLAEFAFGVGTAAAHLARWRAVG